MAATIALTLLLWFTAAMRTIAGLDSNCWSQDRKTSHVTPAKAGVPLRYGRDCRVARQPRSRLGDALSHRRKWDQSPQAASAQLA
jgi:hypothetical protein